MRIDLPIADNKCQTWPKVSLLHWCHGTAHSGLCCNSFPTWP